MTEVKLSEIAKGFGLVSAVSAVDITVASGDLVALLGPSGCGKTTLLRLIAGLEAPDGGTIAFDGRDMTHVTPQDRNVGLVFQRYALFPHMSVADNVAFGLSVRGMAKAEIAARVDGMLDTVQLEAQRDRFPAQLSGGQMQRVALARTLVTEPDVLMLDEPLANLDTGLRGEMRAFIRDLQKRLGITTIFVTHDQSEALEMADRVAVVLDGAVAQYDAPEAIYRRPASTAVAGFMGAENVFAAELVAPRMAKCAFGRIAIPLQDGSGPVTLMLRAEAIDLNEQGEGMAGTIATRDFTGAVVRYGVDVAGARIVVTEPARRLLDPGTPVRVSIAAKDVWVLPN